MPSLRGFVLSAVRLIPEVEPPKKRVVLRSKFFWTALVLLAYFILAEIPIYGASERAKDYFASFRFILAGNAGSLIDLGIGPIVTAGIVMEILVGGKLIKLDLSDPEDRKVFQASQKLLGIIVILVEATVYVLSGRFGRIGAQISRAMAAAIILQLFIGSFLLMMLDELCSRWGIGSGISLFILASVAQEVVWKSFSPLKVRYPELGEVVVGAFPALILEGPAAVSRSYAPNVVGFIATLIAFAMVIVAFNVYINVPLAYTRYGGYRGKYPIKLLYVSNIPIIFGAAFFAELSLVSRILWEKFGYSSSKLASTVVRVFGVYNYTRYGDIVPVSGLAYYLTPPRGLSSVFMYPVKTLIYTLLLIIVCIAFSVMWVYTAGMDADSVATQLVKSGLQIPGSRASPRIIAQRLRRYINAVTILGGLFIALLSAFADMLGALGTGSGILLAVSILYSFYEILMRERLEEMYPVVRRIFGR
ncbi:MAG: preprotein translocase subunit SecY [Thermoproteota archaeon]|nr:MAG: preprotein translocase subunit SecY [Candidatus Korarchaeota archaeon]